MHVVVGTFSGLSRKAAPLLWRQHPQAAVASQSRHLLSGERVRVRLRSELGSVGYVGLQSYWAHT